ncbi:3',5'-cyclic nucleotide phosphodiesterase, putative [Plasmodium malariae]|uniref:Phosphodiesterase n=2 Tax=Plasmodium malariae TaxID=5858 RepID=A0A1D3TEF0_PLAMA|nr:3',5'-cyclic nucleotide phosphodiesterase, putative [Plasmodium malariae]SCP03329.1 3',5'-cyclic nucleotide phosphodiesterase, putative [Plasmodium malariae]
MIDHSKEKCNKNDAFRKAFSLFSYPSNEEERVIKFWPLKFKDNEEEFIYFINLYDNIYKKKLFILISHLSSLLFMYSICLIVGKINDLLSILNLTFVFLHTFAALNIILMLILHYTHYIEKFKNIRGILFIFYTILIFVLWCSWIFILFTDVKDHLPTVVNVNNFLYATYVHNKINIVLCFFGYLPVFYLITVIPCRICYSYIFDVLFFMMKIAIFSVYYIITVKNYILTDNIFMIASSFVGSIFIFIIRYIIEIQRRLAFHNWNKQSKQIIKLKINLREQKERSSVTNIEEIYNIINDSIGDYYNLNTSPREKNICIVNNLEKILNILKEDNLFSPDLKTINKKNYNHIYGYMMDIKKIKQRLIHKGTYKEEGTVEGTEECKEECAEEFKEESETESMIESLSEVRSKGKLDLQSKASSKKGEHKSFISNFDINMHPEELDIDICNTKFLNTGAPNEDIFIHIGKYLLHKYYTASENIPNETLYSLLYEMKRGYNNVPYHNCIHAAMVTQHCNILINNLDTANILRDNEMAAFLVAALGHDIGHFGRTNIFLKNCSNFLSVIYNDKSILENYHCSFLFHILLKEENNIFKKEDSKSLLNLRQQIIELILATDMSKHIKILAQFRIKSIKTKSYIEKNIILCLKMIIKAADLSHNCVDWGEHYLWVKRLVNEFYYEGDEQLERGYQINPLFDRNSHNNFIQIQRTFLKELVYPLITSLKTLDRSTITQVMMDKVKRNYSKWTKIEKSDTRKKKYLSELLNNIPDSWKTPYKPNLTIYQLQKCKYNS